MSAPSDDRLRIDKWLWYARFFKSRALAAKSVEAGRVRVNSVRVSKPARPIRTGDALTFAQGRRIRVVRVLALGTRRGPATEAQALYEDLAPPDGSSTRQTAQAAATPRFEGSGRPTKKDRRALEKSRRAALD